MTYCGACGRDVVGLIYCPQRESEYCFRCHEKVCPKLTINTYAEIFGS